MIYKAGVVGAAGFVGAELVRILATHPNFDLGIITSDTLASKSLDQVYPAFKDITDLEFSSYEESDFTSCDVVFLAVPHTAALSIAPALIEQGITVFDLSADFRLKDPDVYEQWYGTAHTAKDLLAHAFFGLPEIVNDEITQAAKCHDSGEAVLVACAGCYPTATSLAAAPLLKAGVVDPEAVVVVDAISGVSGAGKKATERTHYCFANENLEAYGVGKHRHTPEIEQILDLKDRLVFTPHLAPLNRGLLSTVNLALDSTAYDLSDDDVADIYERFYAHAPMVSVCHAPDLPKTSSVVGTNRAHIGAAVCNTTHMIVAVGAVDNLGKGASGQAMQCANIVFGLDEQTGLDYIAVAV